MFTIPNEADAFHAHQSEIDKVDLDIIVAATLGTGWVSGVAVTAQAVPNQTVAVAAGSISVSAVTVAVTAGNVSLTAADPTNPRFDLIVVDNTGAKSAVAGTAQASPVFPAIPANSMVLAAVYRPANDNTIETALITDKRVGVGTLPADIVFETDTDASGWDFVSTDGTMAANSDLVLPTQKAVRTYVAANAGVGDISSTDTTVAPAGNYWDWVLDEDDFASDSATKVATQQSTKAYIDALPTLTTSDTGKVPVSTVGGVTTLDVDDLLTSADASFSDAAFTLTDNADATKILAFQLSSITTATTRTLTIPDSSGTIVLNANTATLTNKTLTSPIIEAGTLVPSVSLGDARTITSLEIANLIAIDAVTVNYASGARTPLIQDATPLTFASTMNSITGYGFAKAAATIQNTSGSAIALTGMRVYVDETIVQADTQSIANGAYASYRSTPTFQVVNGGTITAGTYSGFTTAPTIGANVTMSTLSMFSTAPVIAGTVTTLNGLKINNWSGAGTVGTIYGVDIAALSGTTAVGIRNLSSLRQVGAATFGTDAAARTGLAVDITSGGLALGVGTYTMPDADVNDLALPACGFLEIDAAAITANRAITGFTGGVAGRVIFISILNFPAFNITFSHLSGSSAANQIRSNNEIAITTTGAGGSSIGTIAFIYSGTDSKWHPFTLRA